MMRRHQVRDKMEEMLRLMREEQDLRIELGALDFNVNTDKELKANLLRQDQLIARIEDLRHEKMFPVVRQVLAFVASRTSQMDLSE
ncbi:hypothetical protein ACFL6C_14255 [Myxococcota bacterium]